MNNFAEFGMLSGSTKAASCETHGDFVSKNLFNSVWSKCPQCAAEQQAIEQREAAEKVSIERAAKWAKSLGAAGIPERFKSRTLASYRAVLPGQKHALEFCQAYAAELVKTRDLGCSAIFCGTPGTGKTHLAVGVALELMQARRTACFSTVQRLVRRVKDSWRKDSEESEGEIIKLFVEVDLLILDEIGVQFGTEFEKNLIFDVLNERYESSKPTLLLSNLTVEQVKGYLGERVFDRLREGGGKAIPFSWDSHRGQA